MNTELVNALSAVGGAVAGAGAKTAARVFRARDQATYRRGRADGIDAEKLRDELWAEIRDLRKRLDSMSDDLEKTRLAYIELMGKYTELRAEHKTLEREHAEVKAELSQIRGHN